MSVFPGFGGWINQNIQQPPKAESRRSENVKSNLVSEKDTNNEEGLNYEEEEMKRQHELWKAAEKKHPWYDAPPKVKVTTKKGLCHMNIELTLGLTPDGVYELFTNPSNGSLFFDMDMNGRPLLATKSRKVLKKDGPRQIVRLKKAVAWDFLWWSGDFPIHLIVDVNKKDLTAKYKKEKMMFMKVFEGNWKIEPLYVDSVRLCKHKEPKSLQEYKTCSGGQGRVASKVTMDQYFQPYTPFNLPPISWFIRDITIRTTKTLLKMLQHASVVLRE
ncbi:unnamed protein product [Arabidopsis lyrata]|uniref:uncharacterized protein LOC9329360 isoform X1 n=1 Tax=Arabidopsis lyrata subsp. lyrata TaxID=81972 RepID=UPI000A29C46E|nr:uncharacterized protein LOC9329360 isoform X1 [Arabidopsis lyrata subsp. lyrata]CAH8253346.1 unnamed protein product [Arabidopsis lyrata]|eukprot:XP_020866884.1 uncharacterized protein LOC9329360 isoform X1 [Arabidopsis lyrata subsp. lyrata]